MGIELDGANHKLKLDNDGDTYLEANTDDIIKCYVAGAEDLRIGANAINVLSGTTLTIDSGATITNSGTANGFGSGKLVKVTLSVGSGTTTASGTTVQDHTSIAHTMESSDNILLLVGLGTANRGSADGGIYCDIYDDTNSTVLAAHRAATGTDNDELPLPTVRVAGYSGSVTFKTRCSSLSGGNKVMLHAGEGIAILELDDS